MTLLYADTSALVRAYFVDEPDHAPLRALLLEGADPVVTSEVARLEFAGAVQGAVRAGRLREASPLLTRVDADCSRDGPIALIALRRERILATAYEILLRHRLRTLDALHVAVALQECPRLAPSDDVAFVTRDEAQAEAARNEGFEIR